VKPLFRSSAVRVTIALACVSVLGLVIAPGVSQAKAAHKGKAPEKYYLSLGDSYSVGYQPNPANAPTFDGAATSGYTAVVAKKLKMNLENFGCGGATPPSILDFTGVCGVDEYGPPAATDAATIPSGDSQLAAAEAFIAANPGDIGLITISIGGNDVTPCVDASGGITGILACVNTADATVSANVTTLTQALRTAVGPGVPIVGITYPDVILGSEVYPMWDPTNSLASASALAFSDFINPALQNAYTASPQDGIFVNITQDTGYTDTTLANLPKSTGVTDVPKHTQVSKALVNVCELTWYCRLGNIHATTKGYTDFGKYIVAAVKAA